MDGERRQRPRHVRRRALAITSHTAGQTVNASNITLAGTATDNGAGGNGIASVTVNGAAATGGTATGSNTANWSRSVDAGRPEPNTLTVVATDGVGNARTSTHHDHPVERGHDGADADDHEPHSGQTLTTSNITLAGTATDNGAAAAASRA